MRNFIATILMLSGIALACAARPHSVPSVATKQVGIDTAANDPSPNPTDGAADSTTTVASDGAPAVVSLENNASGRSETGAADSYPKTSATSALALDMLAESNRIRAAAGKPPQTLDERLCRAAQDQADWCARHGYTFGSPGSAHNFGNGEIEVRAARFGFVGNVAENMHGNRHDLQTAFEKWQESSGHARYLFGNYDRCGFGMQVNPRGEKLWFAVYGTESSQVAAAAPPAPVYPVPTRLSGHYEQRNVRVGLGRWQTQTVWVSDQPAYQPTRFQNVGTCSGGRCQ